jgi:transcriptional regulator GlxA family with amidase domain
LGALVSRRRVGRTSAKQAVETTALPGLRTGYFQKRSDFLKEIGVCYVLHIKHLIIMATKLKETTDWTDLARKASYSTAALAALCGISVRQLERRFDREIGESPEQWINMLRANDAMKLLQDGGMVKEVAAILGFENPESFTRDFTKIFDISPSSVRPIERP